MILADGSLPDGFLRLAEVVEIHPSVRPPCENADTVVVEVERINATIFYDVDLLDEAGGVNVEEVHGAVVARGGREELVDGRKMVFFISASSSVSNSNLSGSESLCMDFPGPNLSWGHLMYCIYF